jgi:hypothetical protein
VGNNRFNLIQLVNLSCRYYINAVEKCLKHQMQHHATVSSNIFFVGDWRQKLPVLPLSSKEQKYNDIQVTSDGWWLKMLLIGTILPCSFILGSKWLFFVTSYWYHKLCVGVGGLILEVGNLRSKICVCSKKGQYNKLRVGFYRYSTFSWYLRLIDCKKNANCHIFWEKCWKRKSKDKLSSL